MSDPLAAIVFVLGLLAAGAGGFIIYTFVRNEPYDD